MKHTSTTWQVEDNCVYALSDNGLSYTFSAVVRAYKLDSDEEMEANLRLMAAAPDLLDALKMAKGVLDLEGYDSNGPCMRIIDFVLSKATGEAV